MIKLELPIIYATNAKEVNDGIDSGYDIEPEFGTPEMQTFYIPSNSVIQIRKSDERPMSSCMYLGLLDIFYTIDLEYSLLMDHIDLELKNHG